jgi:hypothetical protein
VKKSPAIGMDDVLPAEDEAAVFAHYYLGMHLWRSGRHHGVLR